MSIHRIQAWFRALAIGVSCSAALGQYAPGMDGRANDASNQVGSGGINSPIAQPLFNTANLYITGNVSGGRAFRGFSPVADPNSLFLNLPSSSVGYFQRDSIGVSDVLQNRTLYQTNPYYVPTQTVTTAPAVSGAYPYQPGSALGASTYYIPQSGPQPGGPAAIDLSPGGTKPRDTALPYSSYYSADTQALLRGDATMQKLRMAQEVEALRQSPIFGRSVSITSPIVTGALPQGDAAPENAASPFVQPYQRRSRIVDGTDRPLPGEVANNVETLAPTPLAPKLFSAATPAPAVAATTSLNAPAVASAVPSVTTTPLGGVPVPGAVTAEMSTGGTVPIGEFEPPLAPENLASLPAAAELVNRVEQSPEMQESLSATPSLKAQYDRAISVLSTASGRSVETLAGEINTKTNDYVRKAEEASRNGKYYEAVSLYRAAAVSDPDNPLIRLGLGNALAAAGEYLTAVHHLTFAIEHYPAFAYLNFELQTFIPDARVIDVRRADLERLLDKNEDYQLRFLLGYMEYYSGLAQFGTPNLEKAAHAAPTGSTIARFPEVIRKKTPPGSGEKAP